MAGSFSDYLENKLLGHVFGASPYVAPTLYVALFTATPSDAGGGTEVSGAGYARTVGTFTVSGAAPTQAANTASIEFPTANVAWGTVTQMAVFDAATGGNMLAWGDLTTAKIVNAGDIVRFSAGQLTLTLD